MTAAAQILQDAGHEVLGMDENLPESETAGHLPRSARRLPWQADAVPSDIDLCVASRAVPESHPVMVQIQSTGAEVLSLPAFLARMFHQHRQLCVAGTHGKSTTSAMLTWILDQCGRHPGCFVGAHQPGFGFSGRYTSSDCAVIESCEFSRSFVELSPAVAVITGIERDHFDSFPDEASENDAFQAFVSRLSSDGVLVWRANCQRTAAIARGFHGRSTSFSIGSDEPRLMPLTLQQSRATSDRLAVSNQSESPSHPRLPAQPSEGHAARTVAEPADWEATDIRLVGLTSSCVLRHGGQVTQLQLNLPGRHNLENAVAAIAAAAELGIPAGDSCRALQSFRGIQRRFEVRGEYAGVTLVDDYAHHPTAIRSTLQTARAAFSGKRLVAVIEPHQVIRTRTLFADFVNALRLADEVLVLPVFPAREQATYSECCRISGQLVKQLNRLNCKAFLFANLDQIVSRIDHSGKRSDVLLTMGAGRTNLIHDELNRRLQRHSVA